MPDKSQRTMLIEARRRARDAQTTRRQALLERERRIVELATVVIASLDERDAAIHSTEERAAAALEKMITGEGVSVRAAVEACAERLTLREASRLRRRVGADCS